MPTDFRLLDNVYVSYGELAALPLGTDVTFCGVGDTIDLGCFERQS
jgi:hypothetical protein